MIADLEQKTSDLKKYLKEYKESGKDNCKSLKVKFISNMDDLGKSISNFFVKKRKNYNY
jgi:hypothetical protein